MLNPKTKGTTMDNKSRHTPSGSKNVLNSDVEIKGDLKFSGEMTFDGKIDGDIQADEL